MRRSISIPFQPPPPPTPCFFWLATCDSSPSKPLQAYESLPNPASIVFANGRVLHSSQLPRFSRRASIVFANGVCIMYNLCKLRNFLQFIVFATSETQKCCSLQYLPPNQARTKSEPHLSKAKPSAPELLQPRNPLKPKTLSPRFLDFRV